MQFIRSIIFEEEERCVARLTSIILFENTIFKTRFGSMVEGT